MPTPAAEVLAAIRRQRRLKQRELAMKLGVRVSYVSQLETGARRLPAELIARLSEVVQLNPTELAALEFAVDMSDRRRLIPMSATAQEFELVALLWSKLGKLNAKQVCGIRRAINELTADNS